MLLSQLEFGSLFSYTPHPGNEEQRKVKTFVNYGLKGDKITGSPPLPITTIIANDISANLSSLPFKQFFGSDVTLVPVPSSALKKPGDLWVPQNLAKALESKNLGKAVACAQRRYAVPKAATAKPNDRPKPRDHYESIEIKGIVPAEKIVLIDDVITRGSTALGVASRLKGVYQNAEIKIFAAARVVSNPREFAAWRDPRIGKVFLLKNGNARRIP